MAKMTHLKVSGTWKSLKVIWIKVSGSWKYRVISWIRVAGTWKESMTYAALPGNTPYIQGGANIGDDPGDGGWTVTYPRINTSAATPAKCSWESSINMTQGNGATSFYVAIQGIHTDEQICAGTADVRLTIIHPYYGTMTNIISSEETFLNTGKTQVSVNLSSWSWGLHGTTWQNDDVGTITIENVTWGAYAACV